MAESDVVPLRRDTRAVLMSSSGWTPVASAMAAVFLINGPIGSPIVLVWSAGCLLIVANGMLSSVRLAESELVSRSLTGRSGTSRHGIASASDGRMVVIRGARAPGVVLLLRDGHTRVVPQSAFLGSQRRRQWIEQINEWVDKAQETNPHGGGRDDG